MPLRPFLLCLFVWLVAAPNAEAKVTLIVNELRGLEVTPSEADQISSVVRSAVVQTGLYRVVSRDQMDQISKEMEFQQGEACDTTQCQVEIGLALGAQKLIAGSVGKLGKSYVLTLRLIDITTAVEERSITKRCQCELDGILPVASEAVTELFGGSAAAAAPAQAPALATTGPGAAVEVEVAEPSVFERWWFWTAVVAVLGGTAAAVAVATSDGDHLLTVGAPFPATGANR